MIRPSAVCAAAALLLAAAASCADDYLVRIDAAEPRRAWIQARLTPLDGTITLDRHGADSGLYHGWATFVHRIVAHDPDGREIALEYQPRGHWRLARPASGEILVEYEMLLQHDRFPSAPGEDELAYARDFGVLWTGRTLFVSGAPAGAAYVRFELPAGWRVTTPWRIAAGSDASFVADDSAALLDAAVVAGRQIERIEQRGNVQARIACDPALAAEVPMLSALSGRYLDAYAALLGDLPETQLLIAASTGEEWAAGVLGHSISLLFAGPVDADSAPLLQHVLAHEIFHLWTQRFGLREVTRGELAWLLEGAAEYYTLQAALHGGDLDEAGWLRELAARYQRYRAANAGISLADAGADPDRYYDLVYNGGLFAVLVLDIELLAASDGARSFADVLRALLDATRQPVAASGLAQLIAAETGVATARLFKRHIDGRRPLPVKSALARVGLRLYPGRGGTSTQIVPAARPDTSAQRLWTALVHPPE